MFFALRFSSSFFDAWSSKILYIALPSEFPVLTYNSLFAKNYENCRKVVWGAPPSHSSGWILAIRTKGKKNKGSVMAVGTELLIDK